MICLYYLDCFMLAFKFNNFRVMYFWEKNLFHYTYFTNMLSYANYITFSAICDPKTIVEHSAKKKNQYNVETNQHYLTLKSIL